MRTNITKISKELFQSPQKTFYVINTNVPYSFTDSTNRCILNRSDVESFFGGDLEQLHDNFSSIGAHQDFQKPDLFMPELWI